MIGWKFSYLQPERSKANQILYNLICIHAALAKLYCLTPIGLSHACNLWLTGLTPRLVNHPTWSSEDGSMFSIEADVLVSFARIAFFCHNFLFKLKLKSAHNMPKSHDVVCEKMSKFATGKDRHLWLKLNFECRECLLCIINGNAIYHLSSLASDLCG